VAELSLRSARLDQEMVESAASFGETAAQIMLAREGRQNASAVARAAHAELEEARSLLDQVRHSLGTREAELKELRDQLDVEDERVRKHEMALQRIELEREHLLSNVRDRFRGLELHRVVGDYHARPAPDAEHRRRIDELTQIIDRMGPVNLDATAEYEDAEKRFVELSDQKNDIEKALEELERAIKHMNRESRRRFKETFEHVNELFKKTFTRMFRGGRAELILTDPEDLLASGVDIVAQPPGKKLGNIELMSGGEKALTAVSLIFAIFQHKPSPFCVLDEVDAPLDDANVARYNDAIRTMTDGSQFILITHIKKTMQLVDVLYGVTMGEPGVSRIVSVKVNNEAVARSDKSPSALELREGEAADNSAVA
jgi:chromosome segregation protein